MSIIVAPSARSRRPGGARQTLVAVAQVRLMVLALVFGAAMVAILVKLAVLAFSPPPALPADPALGLIPPRGDIVDRNGAPLARSIDGWSIELRRDNGAVERKLCLFTGDKRDAINVGGVGYSLPSKQK